MKIGFIGFGEAAFCICSGLRGEGVEGIIAYDTLAPHETMGPPIQQRAVQAGVQLCETIQTVVAQADILFAAVPSGYTLEVCKLALPYLRQGQIYADVSASTPKTKQEIWTLIESAGVLFADAAMLGSLPQDQHRVPITVSGNGAKAFYDAMTPLGMRITCVEGGAGAASAIKLVRSVYMKGLAALMYEMLQAADVYNVTDDVVQSIARSMDGIAYTEHLKRLVTGTAIHAQRRATELKGSIQLLGECGLDDAMTVASKHKHDLINSYGFEGKYIMSKPSSYDEIIAQMRKGPPGQSI